MKDAVETVIHGGSMLDIFHFSCYIHNTYIHTFHGSVGLPQDNRMWNKSYTYKKIYRMLQCKILQTFYIQYYRSSVHRLLQYTFKMEKLQFAFRCTNFSRNKRLQMCSKEFKSASSCCSVRILLYRAFL